MFSNLYYLSKLIDKSLSFSKVEKQRIFNYVKNNSSELKKLIQIFEDEQRGLNFIKEDYKININKIWENFKNDLINGVKNKQLKDMEKRRDEVKNMKIIELEEKNNEDLDSLINNI